MSLFWQGYKVKDYNSKIINGEGFADITICVPSSEITTHEESIQFVKPNDKSMEEVYEEYYSDPKNRELALELAEIGYK